MITLANYMYTLQIWFVYLTIDVVNITILILNEFDILIMTEESSCNKINTMLQEIQNLLQIYATSSLKGHRLSSLDFDGCMSKTNWGTT